MDTKTQTPLQDTTLEKIEELKRAFGYFYDENLNNVYKAQDYTDPITHDHYKNSAELIDELWELGVPKNTPLKKIELLLEQRYETLINAQEYEESKPTDTNSVSPDEGVRAAQKEELRYRETETLKSQETAREKELEFERRLQQLKPRVFAKQTKDLHKVELTKENKEFIHGMAQAAVMDPGTTQEHIEGLIKASIPESEIENYPESLIRNRSVNFINVLQNFSQYKSPNEIPDSLIVERPLAPLTSLINPNDQDLVNIFTDKFVRENIASDAQQVILTLSTQTDLDKELIGNSVLGGDKNLADVFFGSSEITQFTPDGDQENGIEITTDDLSSLHQNSQKLKSFIQKFIEIDGGGAEVISTGFIPLRVPESELQSVDTSKVIGKKSILGGIEGEETQGALARRILREKAKLIENTVSFNPSTNRETAIATKSLLNKISGEIIPQTLVKSTVVSPLRLNVSIGGGLKPVTLELSGNFGGSAESFLKLMRDTNTPLILTSVEIGSYATSDLALVQAITAGHSGKVLAYLGAGKYSFSVVNAGNTILGGQTLSRYVVGFQLGSKSFAIEFSQKAGKIISSTLLKTTGTGVATRTALPAIVSKIANLLGIAGGWATFGLSTIIGLGLGKLIEWLGPKVKSFIEKNKEVLLIGGLGGMFLFGGGARIIFAVPTLIGAGAIAASGFAMTTVFRMARNFIRTVFTITYADILMPILIFILATPLVIMLILFIINSGAYIVPPNPLNGPGSFSSPFIDLKKTSSQTVPLKNSELPKTVTYTVTIGAKKGSLTNIKIVDKCEVISKTKDTCPTPTEVSAGVLGAMEVKNKFPPDPPDEISPSSDYTITYSMTFDKAYSDANIINTITVTADEPSQAGATASVSNSVTIGNPPISCPLIGGHVATPNLNYSYNGSNNTGHGSNAYWQAMGLNHTYSLPQSSGCKYPGDCSYYGYAYDVFPATSTEVFAPTVLGKDTKWNCSYAFSNGGGSAGYTYHCLSSDGNYLLVLTHVNKNFKSGTVNSGERIGSLYNQGSNTHLHLEFQANGRYVKPETYFCGGK